MAEKGGLKRLGFVENYTKYSVHTAADFYSSAKFNLLPRFAKIQVAKAEELASTYAGPAYSKFVATSYDLLTFADSKVDYTLLNSSKILNSTLQDVKNVAEPDVLKTHLNSAKSAVSANTNKALDFFRQHGLIGTTQYLVSESVNTTKRAVDYGFVQGRTFASSAQQTSKEATNFVFARSQIFIDAATKRSRAAHDAVVKQPLYKNAYERTNDIVTAAQDTKVYKATINRIYPIVAPVYNPAYEKIEPYYKSTVNYWKPATAAA